MNGREPLFFIAGPCVVEGREFTYECADFLKYTFAKHNVPFVYKSSFDKANRSSASSYRGPGIEEGLSILEDTKNKYDVRVTTDIHESWQAAEVAAVVDLIQIPALLCRQTDLIASAAATGRPVNVKKGQFMSPAEMKNIVEKAKSASADTGHQSCDVLLTERGTCFGYNNLVVDMKSFRIMSIHTGCPVLFDATHAVQQPGLYGSISGGDRECVADLACAAVATGYVSGIFFETHPSPSIAKCDGPIQIPFDQVDALLDRICMVSQCVHGGKARL